MTRSPEPHTRWQADKPSASARPAGSTGRYMLVRPATDISTVAPAQGIAIRRTPQGTVTITSADGTALGECAVYSADGTLTGRTNGGTTEVELNAAPGISIVKATKADGTTFTQKIY